MNAFFSKYTHMNYRSLVDLMRIEEILRNNNNSSVCSRLFLISVLIELFDIEIDRP